ncbi:MAG: hypothetical protein IKM61_08335 [Eubacteriaceae bacterium]|nr:hypothetical protein [Eubacteriaceae bacterium]
MGRPKKKPIADHYEIATFWTSLLRDKDSDLKDRLKVSELLMRFMQE